MPLAGRPGRRWFSLAGAASLLDFTVSVACSQGLPALLAMVFRRRGRSCASGLGMMGYQTAYTPVAKRFRLSCTRSSTRP